LADVQAALPPTIAAIESQSGTDVITVRFDFVGKVDVRTFREDTDYVIDVLPIARAEAAAEPDKSEALPRAPEKAQASQPKPAEAKSAAAKPAEIKPAEPKPAETARSEKAGAPA